MRRKRTYRFMSLLLIFLAFLFSCSENGGSNISTSNEGNSSSKSLDSLAQRWMDDSLGCKKFRTKEVAESIINRLKLDKSSKEEFLKVFGRPNIERDNSTIGYYFNSFCINGNFIDSSDYCIAEFTFGSAGILMNRNYLCK